MALSGTFKSSQVTDVGSYPSYVYVDWSATQNIGKNTSTISWKCYGGSYYNNSYRWTTTGPVVVKINGQTVLNKTGRFDMHQGDLLGSGSLTVQHNTDGTKTVPVSISAAIYYGTINSTYSGNIALNTIPRASSITNAAEVTIGNQCNIKWTPANKDFRYKLKFSLGSWSSTIPSSGYITPGNTSTYTYTGYTIPTTLYQQLPNDYEGTMSVVLYTYNSTSSTPIGTSEPKYFTVTIPSSIKPTAGTVTLTPTSVTLGGNSYPYLIKGHNKLAISVSGASAGTGSTIKSYTFSGPSISVTKKTSNASCSAEVDSVNYSINSEEGYKTLTYTVTVTDSRDRSETVEKTITCYDYTKPSVTLKVSRNEDKVTCTYKASYASIDGKNSATVKIYADKTLQKTIENVANGVSGEVSITLNSKTATYDIYAIITDSLGTDSQSKSNNVYGASKVINITPDGTGVAFGKMAEEKNCVDVPKLVSRNNVLIRANGRGFYINNPNGTIEPAIYRNTSGNLWIGSKGTTEGNITGGGTYISTGDKNNLYVGKYVENLGGRATYPILDTENYKTYLPMNPTTLYSKSSGTSGGITLANSVQNYTYIEIFYMDNNSRQRQSVRVYSPSGAVVDLSCIEATHSDADRAYIRTSRYEISDKKIDFTRSKYITLENSSTPVVTTSTTTNYIYITRVVGYSSE